MSVRDTQTDAGGTRCAKAPVNLLVTNSRYNTDMGEPCRQDSPHANLPYGPKPGWEKPLQRDKNTDCFAVNVPRGVEAVTPSGVGAGLEI